MSRFSTDSLATIEFVLRYEQYGILCEDQYLARRVNPWRDILPSALYQKLLGAREGDVVSCVLAPGEGVAPAREANVRILPPKAFHPPEIGGRRPVPCPGRFYPQGLFRGLAGVYPSTIVPARLLRVGSDGLRLDLNHPLARHGLTLEARLLRVEDKRSDTGGTLHHWMETLCDWGPGMQLPGPEGPAVFDGPGFMSRPDDRDDTVFYAHPRMTAHVDARASENLRDLYARHLRPGMRVLDLMSSVESHLPDDMGLRVTGLGMNREELEANPALHQRVVHDLNADPALPRSILSGQSLHGQSPDPSLSDSSLSNSTPLYSTPPDVTIPDVTIPDPSLSESCPSSGPHAPGSSSSESLPPDSRLSGGSLSGAAGTFDAVIISLSFEYLTRPVEVLASVRDHLAPGGVVLLGTSDRWFPPKAIAGWLEMHEFERMAYMLDCLRRAGFRGPMGTVSRRNDWRPVEDTYFVQTRGVSDPVFMVWAEG